MNRPGTNDDFRLTVMRLFAACTAIGLIPFALYRFSTGNWFVGSLDLAVVVLVALPTLFAWRTGKVDGAALAVVATICIGVVTSSALLGRNGVMWAYCAVLASFLLTDRRIAFAASLFTVAGSAVLGEGFLDPSERASFVMTATIGGVFAFLFAYRTDVQRQQLEDLASHDSLTGAGNRRLLERELQAEVRQFERWPRPVALVVLDLDHFKAVNDQFGHEAGDRVLASFASVVRGCLRKLDRLYRLGGEEFVLLLPATPPSGLPTALDKLHDCLRSQLIGPGGVVTVSMGAASLHAGETWAEWLARADAALYRAKHGGRDRYEIDLDPRAHTGSVQVLAERRKRR